MVDTAVAHDQAHQPHRRLLAVGLLIIALGFVWLAVVEPVLDAFSGHAERAEAARALTAQYRAVAAERPLLEQQSRMYSDTASAPRFYLTAATDGAAGATVQQMVKAAVEKAGGKIQSTELQPVSQEEGFRRIGVRMQFIATVEQLRLALHALETGEPFLFVDTLDVRVRQNPRGNDAAASDRALDVRIALYGFARSP